MKTIIFDCDGVLIDSEILYQEIMIDHVKNIGISYEVDDFVAKYMGTGEGYFYDEIALEYQNKFGTPLSNTFRPSLKDRLHKEFEVRLQAVGGMHDFVSTLPHVKAVASSSGLGFLKKKLKQTRIDTFFDPHIYSADQVARAKPYPDLFLFTADKMNTAPSDCIVIEDSAHGIKAGKAAGMHTIGFCGGLHCNDNHAKKLKIAGADDIAMTVDELKSLL